MKKSVFFLLAVVACVGLCSCGTETKPGNETPTNETSAKGSTEKEDVTSPSVEIVSERVITYTDSLGDPEIVYVAEVKNTGAKTIELSDVSVDLEDINGKIIDSTSFVSTYPDIVNPGKSSYICESLAWGEDIDLDTVGNAILHYSAETCAEASMPNVSITELSAKETYGHTSFVARAENMMGENLTDLYIAAPVRNAKGELQSVAFTIIDSLNGGEKKGFELNMVAGDTTADFSQSTVEPFSYVK